MMNSPSGTYTITAPSIAETIVDPLPSGGVWVMVGVRVSVGGTGDGVSVGGMEVGVRVGGIDVDVSVI